MPDGSLNKVVPVRTFLNESMNPPSYFLRRSNPGAAEKKVNFSWITGHGSSLSGKHHQLG